MIPPSSIFMNTYTYNKSYNGLFPDGLNNPKIEDINLPDPRRSV